MGVSGANDAMSNDAIFDYHRGVGDEIGGVGVGEWEIFALPVSNL